MERFRNFSAIPPLSEIISDSLKPQAHQVFPLSSKVLLEVLLLFGGTGLTVDTRHHIAEVSAPLAAYSG